MKRCPTCNQEKSEEEFYKDKRTPDGFKSQCKKCHTAGNIRTRNQLNHKLHNREFMRKDRICNAEKYQKRERKAEKLREKNERTRARYLLNLAVKTGKIIKPDHCQNCGQKRKVTGHHHDYSKPLEVDWLCYECHATY